MGYNPAMRTNEHKANAAAAGLDWSAVVELYREARAIEAAELDRRTAARRAAFQALAGDIHGGRVKIGNRAGWTTGDATNIQGIDVVAAGLGMTADELYAELQRPAPAARDADDVMTETIARAAALAASPAADDGADLMPLVEAAALADVTEQWLRALVKSGRVRGRKAGRNWRVSRADVEFFRRHPTAGRPRFRAFQESAPF